MVNLTPGKQFVVRSRINELSLIHDKDAVGAHGGGNALRYHDLRFARDF